LPLRAAGGDFNDDLQALGYQLVKVALREQIALGGRGRFDFQSADTSALMHCRMPQSSAAHECSPRGCARHIAFPHRLTDRGKLRSRSARRRFAANRLSFFIPLHDPAHFTGLRALVVWHTLYAHLLVREKGSPAVPQLRVSIIHGLLALSIARLCHDSNARLR
jgi:hypothetical protein